MDLHIERPELNAKTAEENIAAVDTWIADTADKLNIALTSLKTTSAETTTVKQGRSTTVTGLIPYLGKYRAEATQVIYTSEGD